MRLNWFSPLPPARTDVANYALRVLPALARRAELVLWTDQAEVAPLPLLQAEVRRYHPDHLPWSEVNRADLSIYHIGNNQDHHGSPWLVSRRHPGIVVLHDVCLPLLFVDLFRKRLRDYDSYCDLMTRYYGDTGASLAAAFWDDVLPTEHMARRCPLTEPALEGALGVLVHTPGAYERLQAGRRWPLAYQPLGYAPAAARPPRAAPPRPGEPYRLVLFGHISANRRLEQVLDALAGLPERERFHLDVYGPIWDPQRIERRAGRPELRQRVRLHGFVSDAALEAGLRAAHLAINLRHPTMGEASGSQMKIWEHALPSLVSAEGWYATLPSSAVALVRPEYEADDLQHHLRRLLAEPEAYARMGEEGRRLLEANHGPEAYAEALLRLGEEARRHRPRSLGYYLAERAGAVLGAWSGEAGLDVRPVAERIAGLIGAVAVDSPCRRGEPAPSAPAGGAEGPMAIHPTRLAA
jgi:glycosyltransferase involved in cell wall biosynthesis